MENKRWRREDGGMAGMRCRDEGRRRDEGEMEGGIDNETDDTML
jgi:hypothetical protein